MMDPNALTIALSKGRILKDTLPLLASAGIELLEDPDKTRKLILNWTMPYSTKPWNSCRAPVSVLPSTSPSTVCATPTFGNGSNHVWLETPRWPAACGWNFRPEAHWPTRPSCVTCVASPV